MPMGPFKKPNIYDIGWCYLHPSKIPAMTLCPPGAYPPESTNPILNGVYVNDSFLPSVCNGWKYLNFSESLLSIGNSSPISLET